MANTTDSQNKLLTPLLVHILSGRSGSTLLMQLLSTSNEIVFDRVYPFEVRYLTYLARWASMLKTPVSPSNKWNFGTNFMEPGTYMGPFPTLEAKYWDKEMMWQQAILSSWQQFSQVAIDKSGVNIDPRYYAEKSAPWLPAHIKDILPYRTITLVRDPRDIFLSILAFNKKRGYPAFDQRRWESNMAFARRWVEFVRERASIAKVALDTHKGVLIKYEELVSDLAGQAKKLGDWLGVKLDDQIVENRVGDFAHHMTSKTPSLSVGRWKREMKPKLINFITSELHDELTYFGYDTKIT